MGIPGNDITAIGLIVPGFESTPIRVPEVATSRSWAVGYTLINDEHGRSR